MAPGGHLWASAGSLDRRQLVEDLAFWPESSAASGRVNHLPDRVPLCNASTLVAPHGKSARRGRLATIRFGDPCQRRGAENRRSMNRQ
jgi:hypothetical protein